MSAILQAFKDADLRKKILISLALIILYRIGAQIPSPGVDYVSISARIHQLTSDSQGVYALINLFSGGALLQLSIFAIGVMPYITASIIVQLLPVVHPVPHIGAGPAAIVRHCGPRRPGTTLRSGHPGAQRRPHPL